MRNTRHHLPTLRKVHCRLSHPTTAAAHPPLVSPLPEEVKTSGDSAITHGEHPHEKFASGIVTGLRADPEIAVLGRHGLYLPSSSSQVHPFPKVPFPIIRPNKTPPFFSLSLLPGNNGLLLLRPPASSGEEGCSSSSSSET
ncbi:hypothetical protein C0Q70_02857 [Pomacea canaliculata]|uniref:Uncharacterized protein n=1 Tax=Pomacea canaliculata TaxID=400727 RepID=A0A2T7PR45_POMCA|nr:hypothetical protein C0Q70_02857 [Pomacea canaliculata]